VQLHRSYKSYRAYQLYLFPRSSDLTRRVVITGLGLVTPVGNTVEDTWTSLMAGRSGADYIKKFDAEKFSVRFACEVKNFDPLSTYGRSSGSTPAGI